MICTASDTFRTLVYSALIPAYSIIFSVIKTFMNVKILLRHIQAYSGPCVTLTYSEPCHSEPGIFRTGSLFKILWNVDQHIQNFVIGHYSGIFKTLCNACIFRNLAYLEFWKIQNSYNYIPKYIQNPVIFRKIYEYSQNSDIIKPDTYSESSQRFNMEFFAKIFKYYNYLPKALYRRPLTGIWIRLSLNKYSLTCRVISR